MLPCVTTLLRGTRAHGSALRNWGDNVSILGALTLGGTLEPMCVEFDRPHARR